MINSLGGQPIVIIQPTVLQIGNYLQVTNYTDGEGQWYYNNQPISGAINQLFYPAQSGLYSFVVSDNLACSNISKPIEYKYSFDVSIYPNPSENMIFIDQTII